MSDVTSESGKRTVRAAARAHRALTDPAERSGAAAWVAQLRTVPEFVAARTVAAYVSYGTEPPTDALLEELRGRRVRILLPVLLDDKDLDWTDGASDSLGVGAIAEADVVVVPALLVDASGTRLGQGGGSYDRALRRARVGTPFIALVHDDEVLFAGALSREPHDVAVTHAVTPTRVVALGAVS